LIDSHDIAVCLLFECGVWR